jgi:hypothetical protein
VFVLRLCIGESRVIDLWLVLTDFYTESSTVMASLEFEWAM